MPRRKTCIWLMKKWCVKNVVLQI
ncbi:unnamed protein product [Timema podura]|uniref:Ribosomal protein L16 n=1 Tax=Timema podura TaxID=61482 RepID=A0ABN7P777_TIMPD|nr:unnamed protein product [Timema podura]